MRSRFDSSTTHVGAVMLKQEMRKKDEDDLSDYEVTTATTLIFLMTIMQNLLCICLIHFSICYIF